MAVLGFKHRSNHKVYAFVLIPLWKLRMFWKRQWKAGKIQEVMGVKSKGHSFISSMGKRLPQGMTRSSKPNLTTEPSTFYKLFQRIFKWFCRHVFPVVVLYALHYTGKYFLTCHLVSSLLGVPRESILASLLLPHSIDTFSLGKFTHFYGINLSVHISNS